MTQPTRALEVVGEDIELAVVAGLLDEALARLAVERGEWSVIKTRSAVLRAGLHA